MRKLIPTIIVIAVLLLSQYAMFPGWGIQRLGKLGITFVGMFSLLWFCRNLKTGQIVLLLPFVYMIFRGVFAWVPGYTAFELLYFGAVLSIVCLYRYVSLNAVLVAVLTAAVFQVVFRYTNIVPWAMELSGKSYHWGTVRHHIRYTTVIFAGIMVCWHYLSSRIDKNYKFALSVLLIGGCYEICVAYSNTIIVVTLLSSFAMLAYTKNYAVGALVVTLVTVAWVWKSPTGFSVDAGRVEMWTALFSDMQSLKVWLFGRGIGAWVLRCGTLGFENCGHPHNELFALIYEQGIIGLFFWCIPFVVGLVSLWPDKALFIAYLGLTLSMCTNSLRYLDMFVLWSVFHGIGYLKAVNLVFPFEVNGEQKYVFS